MSVGAENSSNRPNGDIAPFQLLSKYRGLLVLIQIFLFVMLAITTSGGSSVIDASNPMKNGFVGYSMFSGVEIMMFIGFGYLMTFMKYYGFSAVGFTMIVTALGLQWAILTEAFFDQWRNLSMVPWNYIDVSIYTLMNALFACSAVLITLGALIGAITPLQLIFITFIEIACHSFNFKIILTGLNVSDLGGTFIDHMFGAYFGLAVSYMLPKPKHEPEDDRNADLFSMIGTLFLWVYWPSFVAGAAPPNSAIQQTAIVNTVLALSASTIATFIASSFFEATGRIRPVDIQNATLAGGVAIGCVSGMTIQPAGAIAVGFVAGIVSTYGFNKLKIPSINDTCGINNLHGMPSLIGGLSSALVCAANRNKDAAIYGDTASSQWFRQILGVICTLSYAIVMGLTVGYIANKLDPKNEKIDEFTDVIYWKAGGDYPAPRKPVSEIEMHSTEAAAAKEDVVEVMNNPMNAGKVEAPTISTSKYGSV